MSGKINIRREEGDAHEKARRRLLPEPSVYERRMKIGQSSMLLIIVVLAMFAAIAIFLLQLAGNVSDTELTSMKADRLLISMLRTDTGYTDEKCKTVADLVTCACFSSTWTCGGVNCDRLANETVTRYMAEFQNNSQSMRYLFFSASEVNCVDSEGNSMMLKIGDLSLEKSKKSDVIFSQPVLISKSYSSGGSNPYYMRMQLKVAPKPDSR